MAKRVNDRLNKVVLEKASKAIDAAFLKTKSNINLKKFAVEMKTQVVKRTRQGFGVKANQRRYRLPKLSASYIETRKGKLRFFTNKKTKRVFSVQKGVSKSFTRFAVPNLSSKTKPGKSNITATGFLLNNLRVSILNSKAAVVPGFKVRTRDIFGDKIKDPPTDAAVMGYLRAQNRIFMNLSKDEEGVFLRRIGRRIKLLTKGFLAKN